jgi:hypothetical protein
MRPLPLGGLGILDLWLMGVAHRLRSLWLQWTEPSCPWGTMPISIDCQTRSFFRVLGRISLGDGNVFLFWTDPWLDGSSIAELAPDVLHAIPGQRRHKMVAEALTNGSWICDITGALTIPVLAQYLQVRHRLQDVQLILEASDIFEWKWSPTGSYFSRSAYKALLINQSAVLGAK